MGNFDDREWGISEILVNVLDYLASGMTAEEIAIDFPELTEDDVFAAIKFAANRERRLTASV